ncbi:MAG: hypothetical protein HOH74_22255, partial [Gemmatimonadetes bacterium]|nr:hypothetical protein [Gemmatimonadota bacterium]
MIPFTLRLSLRSRLFLASVAALLVLHTGARADEEGIPDDVWPASWFEAPRTASEAGITSFQEAPSLASRVAAGE